MDQRESPVEFEAVNHKYGTRARTLAEAMWVALRSTRRPYCLDDIDLEALNDTDPGRRMGGFQLPDWYHEARAAEEQERYYREQYGIGRTRMAQKKYACVVAGGGRYYVRETGTRKWTGRNQMSRICGLDAGCTTIKGRKFCVVRQGGVDHAAPPHKVVAARRGTGRGRRGWWEA